MAAGAKLHLVKPFGFEISDSRLKRAGLDYWQHLEVFEYDSVDDFFEQHRDKQMAFLSSHGAKSYWDVPFDKDIFLVFGKESKGLSKEIISAHSNEIYKIPLQSDKVRSLNLANAVAIVAYEGLRQLNS